MGIEADLRMEIEKWAKRIEEEIENVKLKDEGRKDLLANVNAYVKDSGYFLRKGDLIRSFEAIIWAWSWIDILKELGMLE